MSCRESGQQCKVMIWPLRHIWNVSFWGFINGSSWLLSSYLRVSFLQGHYFGIMVTTAVISQCKLHSRLEPRANFTSFQSNKVMWSRYSCPISQMRLRLREDRCLFHTTQVVRLVNLGGYFPSLLYTAWCKCTWSGPSLAAVTFVGLPLNSTGRLGPYMEILLYF